MARLIANQIQADNKLRYTIKRNAAGAVQYTTFMPTDATVPLPGISGWTNVGPAPAVGTLVNTRTLSGSETARGGNFIKPDATAQIVRYDVRAAAIATTITTGSVVFGLYTNVVLNEIAETATAVTNNSVLSWTSFLTFVAASSASLINATSVTGTMVNWPTGPISNAVSATWRAFRAVVQHSWQIDNNLTKNITFAGNNNRMADAQLRIGTAAGGASWSINDLTTVMCTRP
jgi:hypothetical protein